MKLLGKVAVLTSVTFTFCEEFVVINSIWYDNVNGLPITSVGKRAQVGL